MKTLGIGIVGAGWISSVHIRAIQDSNAPLKVLALCDRDQQRAKSVAEFFNIPHITSKHEDLLKIDELAAVSVAVPTAYHADIAIAAAQAGKHIMCEKPMSRTADECRKMIDAAANNHVLLMPVHNRLFFPPIIKAKQAVDEGVIGQPRVFRANFLTPFHPATVSPPNWRADRSKSGGGIAMEAGVHLIYTSQHFMGPIVNVQAQLQKFLSDSTEDAAAIQLQFASGAMGSLILQNGSGFPDDSLQVSGTKGAVLINGVELQPLRCPPLSIYTSSDHGWQMPDVEWNWDQSFRGLWTHFADVVLNKAAPMLSGQDGQRALAVVEAIYASAKSGNSQPVN